MYYSNYLVDALALCDLKRASVHLPFTVNYHFTIAVYHMYSRGQCLPKLIFL